MLLTILVGNPKPMSRTLQIAREVAGAVAPRQNTTITEIDLADYADELFVWPSDTMTRLTEHVAKSDLLVVGSPTYKATYTGLLKSFLDRYPKNGLAGVTAIPVMTGADLTHAMAPDVHLRPLLVELGATVPTRSLYFVTSEMARAAELVQTWVTDNVTALPVAGR